MENKHLGVRRGAWTPQEDSLLRKCIENYGEGKWYLVPFRAGLNRCRKSCRLRWLNYLKPTIKRGIFSEAEIDLLIRLHKLLGNRWTLIAGRLPGRTTNDVKNFWFSHVKNMKPATDAGKSGEPDKDRKLINQYNILRPIPRIPTALPPGPTSNAPSSLIADPQRHSIDSVDECMQWWRDMLKAADGDDLPEKQKTGTSVEDDGSQGLDDFCIDVEIWDVFYSRTDIAQEM